MSDALIPDKAAFEAALLEMLQDAESKGLSSLEVRAGDLHERVGRYPGRNHRMPICCAVMRNQMRNRDAIVSEPPKGRGASLTVRYWLPR